MGRVADVFSLMDARPDVGYMANEGNHDCHSLVKGLKELTLNFAGAHNITLRESHRELE